MDPAQPARGSAALDSARPGERWVVRHRLSDGSATDLIGWVDAVTDQTVSLGGTDGHQQTLERARVVAARRAPPAPGGPDPIHTPAAELERHALRGWLAHHEALGEWTLRAADGFTGRANSCLAIGDPGMPIADAAEAIVRWSREHRIQPWAQVVVGSGEEAQLRTLGWVPAYVTTEVLVSRLAEFLGATPPDARVQITEELTPAWEAAYQESRPNNADPDLLRMILNGGPPRAFGAVSHPGDPSLQAIARGHVSGPWLGWASIWTRPEQRRLGLATAVMRGLGHWGARRGARYGYVQVAAGNAGALTAYRRQGFAKHHSYRVLAAPAPG